MNKIIILIGVIAMLFSTSAKAQNSDVELEGLQLKVLESNEKRIDKVNCKRIPVEKPSGTEQLA